MRSFIRQSAETLKTPQQGFDPLRTLSQICALQALHYLTLALLVPMTLRVFPGVSQEALRFEGGALQLGMLLDWREMAGRPTWDWDPVDRPSVSWSVQHKKLAQLYSNASKEDLAAMQVWQAGSVWLDDDKHQHAPSSALPPNLKLPLVIKPEQLKSQEPAAGKEKRDATSPAVSSASDSHQKEVNLERWEWERTRDSRRGWAIAFAWLLTAAADVHFLAQIIRRPKHVLDHVLTLHLLNLLLTSLYASSLPTSLFWWLVMALHGALCTIFAERMCIRRELTEGFSAGPPGAGSAAAEEGRVPTERTADLHAAPHVLFDEADEADDVAPRKTNGHGHGDTEAYEMKARIDKAD